MLHCTTTDESWLAQMYRAINRGRGPFLATLSDYLDKLRVVLRASEASESHQCAFRTTAKDVTGDSTDINDSMAVLAVTTHRPEEVLNSVMGDDGGTAVVTIDGEKGTIGRGFDAIREVRRSILSHDPDVVILDCHELLGFLTTVLCILYGVQVFPRLVGDTWRIFGEEGVRKAHREHDYGRLLNYALSLLINRFTFSQAAGFIVVSEDLKQVTHRKTGCPMDRIAVVPVPLTMDTAQTGQAADARRSLDIKERQVILTVTNLAFEGKYEGVRQTVDEIRSLLEAHPDLAYVVAGDGEYHTDLQTYVCETIDDPDVRRRIYTPGFVDDVSDLYDLADIFVYISYLDGYPNAVLEAQTAGLPVVSNGQYGMCEQIDHDETGLLVDSSQAGAIRAAVERLYAEPADRDRLGQNARETVLERNDPKAVARRLRASLTAIADGSSEG